jgi:hypothetical protein
MWYKRLERGSFRFPSAAPAQETKGVEVKAVDLMMILDLVDLGSVRRQRRYERQPAWNSRKEPLLEVMRAPIIFGMSESDAPLPTDLDLCHEIIRQQAATIEEARRRIERLEHQIERLLRRQYGPRRESIDLFAYLQDVLSRLPTQPADQLDELLPDVWFASPPGRGAIQPLEPRRGDETIRGP